jgi:endonuclease/exonuclease/phosphatase family metal-dependent hydrolase
MIPHYSIHKHICTTTDGKTHNQIDHILRNKKWYSNIVDVQSFRGADSDTDHYPVVAKVIDFQ